MADATTPPDLERRKQVRLRLRPDLETTPQFYEGVTYYVVKDPVSLRYYRFSEADHFLLRQWDGSRTMEEARQNFEERFRPQRLLLEDLEALGQMLIKAGLAVHELPQAGRQLFERRRRRRRTEWLQRLTNILYIEVPLLDPDPLLRMLLRRLGGLLSPAFLGLGLLFMLSALLFIGTHFEGFCAKLPSAQEFFHYQNLLYLWVALGLVKIVHELAHGLTCTAMGGEVHDMGVLLLCLSPCLYMNVSDAWTLPDKSKRMAVGLAGVYVELLIAAAATFLWWNTTVPLIHHLSQSLMIVCSVNTVLFNGNPLLRYDGYYVLADWLEVPNLRERCNAYLKRLAMKHCLGMEVAPEAPMAWQRRVLFVVYAVGSYVYGWVVAFGILWTVAQFLKPYKLGSISLLMAFAALASMVGWPLGRTVYGIYRKGKLPAVAPRPTSITAAVLATLLVLIFVVPLPVSRVRQVGLDPASAGGRFEGIHCLAGYPGEAPRPRRSKRPVRRHPGRVPQPRAGRTAGRGTRTQHITRQVQLKALRQQVAETTDAAERSRIELAISQADGERKLYAQQVSGPRQNAPRPGAACAAGGCRHGSTAARGGRQALGKGPAQPVLHDRRSNATARHDAGDSGRLPLAQGGPRAGTEPGGDRAGPGLGRQDLEGPGGGTCRRARPRKCRKP